MTVDNKITVEEMTRLFGTSLPREAAEVLFNAPDGWTIEQVRAEVRRIAEGLDRGPLTFKEIGDLARSLTRGVPTPIPAISDVEAAALVGALRACWLFPNGHTAALDATWQAACEAMRENVAEHFEGKAQVHDCLHSLTGDQAEYQRAAAFRRMADAVRKLPIPERPR